MKRKPYPEYILKKVRQNYFDLEEDDTSMDEEIQDLRPDTVFISTLDWEGLINYAPTIKRWIKDIYGVDLYKEAETNE